MDYEIITDQSLPYWDVRLIKNKHGVYFVEQRYRNSDGSHEEFYGEVDLDTEEQGRAFYENRIEKLRDWEPTYSADNQPSYYSSMAMRNYRSVTYSIVAKSKVLHVDPEDMCDPTSQTYVIQPKKVDGPCDAREIAEMIGRSLSPSRCGCSHDCCGHRFGSSTARWLTMDRLEVEIGTARNY